MSTDDRCDFISDEIGHLSCELASGHAGDHRGDGLTCGPMVCDHAAPKTLGDDSNRLVSMLEELDMAEALWSWEPRFHPNVSPSQCRDLIDSLREQYGGRLALAMSFYVQRVFPEDPHLARQFAVLMTAAGRFDDALDVWQSLVRADWLLEMKARDMAGMAACYSGRGQHERALELADEALAISPDGVGAPFAHYERYSPLASMGEFDGAMEALAAAEALLANDDDMIDQARLHRLVWRGRCMVRVEAARAAGRAGAPGLALAPAWRAALDEIDRWIALDSGTTDAHLLRANVLRRLERFRESLDALDVHEATFAPNDDSVRCRAEALLQLDEPEHSLEVIERWATRHPTRPLHPMMQDTRILALIDAGRLEEAAVALRDYERTFGRSGLTESLREGIRWSDHNAARGELPQVL